MPVRADPELAFLRSADPDTGPGASEGECYLYVFPSAGEDLLKLGFSRNPLGRMQALHPRYYEFFDLERGWLARTDSVREARRLERDLHRSLGEYNAPAPLTVRKAAAGHGEWYRGAYAGLWNQADRLRAVGHALHWPLRDWAAAELARQGERLYDRGAALLAQLQGEPGLLDDPALSGLRRNLLDSLDAYPALSVELHLPEPLLHWYYAAR